MPRTPQGTLLTFSIANGSVLDQKGSSLHLLYDWEAAQPLLAIGNATERTPDKLPQPIGSLGVLPITVYNGQMRPLDRSGRLRRLITTR